MIIDNNDIIEWMYKKDKSKELLGICWIYLLIDYDESDNYINVSYVWQSKDIGKRLQDHKHNKIIKFTHIYPISCSYNQLNDIEQEFIYLYNPEYNHAFNTRWWYRKHIDAIKFLSDKWYSIKRAMLNRIIKDCNIQYIERCWIRYYNCYQILKLLSI